jgi:outer membrane receptor protein involved in Fe transport
MRDSFSENGYGAPMSFNSIDTMDIVKGPASVQAGPGAGVGGSINIETKAPSFSKFSGAATFDVDTDGHRRQTLDFGGPASDTLAYRISYSGEESSSYYDYMFLHQQSLYGALTANISDKYTIQVNSEYTEGRYRENDGVNRANQQFIDSGVYLTGGVVGGPSNISGFGSTVQLGNPVLLNRSANVDGAPGTGARSERYNLQVIQTYDFNQNASVSNNTFFNYMNRYNQTEMYWADSSKNSYTLENKTDFKFKFDTPVGDQGSGNGLVLKQAIDAGFTFREAHNNEVQNFANEPVSIFDLGNNPSTLAFPSSLQAAGGALPYTGAFGQPLYGVAARNAGYLNNSIVSDLYDVAAFLEHRIEVSPQFSVMYGARLDGVKLHYGDPLNDPSSQGYPASATTNAYLLKNGNFSPVYKPLPWVSTYLTANFAQYVDPNSQDGGVGVYGEPATDQLRQSSRLLEAGVKMDLLHKSLFWGTDVFKQERTIPSSYNGKANARILGFETELNYQPNAHFFATASYSYIQTKLDSPETFYNFPAQAGTNVDGSGILAVWQPNQTFNDPGVPRQMLNFLANYKADNGFGAQANMLVTGPIEISQSGWLDIGKSQANGAVLPASALANGGYFQAPVIPWQYTINTSFFYNFMKDYQLKFSIYNLTNRRNLMNDAPIYGNDFITVLPPRSFALMGKVKF